MKAKLCRQWRDVLLGVRGLALVGLAAGVLSLAVAARAQMDEAAPVGRGEDATVSALPGGLGSEDGVGAWQSAFKNAPDLVGQNFSPDQISSISRILSRAGTPSQLINPKVAASKNRQRILAAVARISQATVTQARKAVSSRSLNGQEGENLSWDLADVRALGQAISGVSAQSVSGLQKSLKVLIFKQNEAAEAAIENNRRPNFDGQGRRAALTPTRGNRSVTANDDVGIPVDYSGEARSIAQYRLAPFDENPALWAETLPDGTLAQAQKGRRLAGAAGFAAASGPVAAVPADVGTAPLSPAGKSNSGPKPMGEARIVQSDLETVGDAFDHAVTHSYPGKPGTDPIQALVDFIHKYTAYRGLPNSEKHLILKYYEMSAPPLLPAIKAAVKAGIPITFETDLNNYLVGKFSKGARSNWDFEHAAYKDTPDGVLLRQLRAMGFNYDLNHGRLTILSGEPLFDPTVDRENPLMHDKVATAKGANGEVYSLSLGGTFNPTQPEAKSRGPLPSYGGRYNRILWAKDPAAITVDWEHALAEAQAYNLRLGGKGLAKQDHSPVRVVYKDGTYQEIAFTDGIQNPNDRMTDLLTRAADPKNGISIDEIVYSHFVLTDTGEVQALRKLMAAQKGTKIYGVFDQMFIPLDGYGLAGALAGFVVQRPMGHPVYPFSASLASRMTLLGYQRLLDGSNAGNTDPRASEDDDNPAGIHLWHDKTTAAVVTETNPRTGQKVQYVYVWTRTLNNSNHYENMESQVEIKMLATAPLAKEIIASIKETAQSESQYALYLPVAIARVVLGHYSGKSAYSVTPQRAQDFINAFKKSDYDAVSSIMSGVAALPAVAKGLAAGASQKKGNVAQFVGFLKWYEAQRKKDSRLNPMTYQRGANVAVALLKNKTVGMAAALDVLYFNSRLTQEEMNALMKKAWAELKMPGEFPSRQNTKPQASKPAAPKSPTPARKHPAPASSRKKKA